MHLLIQREMRMHSAGTLRLTRLTFCSEWVHLTVELLSQSTQTFLVNSFAPCLVYFICVRD
jgi:hypothetical protein